MTAKQNFNKQLTDFLFETKLKYGQSARPVSLMKHGFSGEMERQVDIAVPQSKFFNVVGAVQVPIELLDAFKMLKTLNNDIKI